MQMLDYRNNFRIKFKIYKFWQNNGKLFWLYFLVRQIRTTANSCFCKLFESVSTRKFSAKTCTNTNFWLIFV